MKILVYTIHIHVYTHIHIHTHTHANTHKHTHTNTQTYRCAVQALLNANPTTNILVYTGDIETQQDILTKANERFSIDLTGASDMPRIRFVRLKFRALLEASRYPMFTLLGQSLGGALLALEGYMYVYIYA